MDYLVKKEIFICTLLFCCLSSDLVQAAAPKLNFSDLISGPAVGLEDGNGSGVIVTVWGQHLGSSQDASTISLTDSLGVVHENIYIYYWKNADGLLPGGPANLFESHQIQELAFSIPPAADGLASIAVTVNNSVSNALPFTVRDGAIYHVMQSGSDATGNGSFNNPWATIDTALDDTDAPGATIYVHNSITTGSATEYRAVYWNNSSASSGYTNQSGLIAFPNSQPEVIGRNGFRNYNTAGQVVSKFSVFASDCDEDLNGQPVNCATNPANQSFGIQTSAFGRSVGNTVTDRAGGCVDGQQGAISGNAIGARDRVSGYQILGNEIYEYGCNGSSKFHHTTYLSVRSGSTNLQVDPWRFGWNYLRNNQVKNGIHQYDENNTGVECGSPNGTVVINDNVIINQSGAGINLGANCPWLNDFEVYNNVIINSGLAFDWDGIDPNTTNGPNTSAITVMDGDLMGSVYIQHNTFLRWNDDDQIADTQACLGLQGSGDNTSIYWNNNVCYTNKDKPFVNFSYQGPHLMDNISGDKSSWFYSGTNAIVAVVPTWDGGAISTDPLITVSGAQLILNAASPLIGISTTSLTHGVYGIPRAQNSAVGAVEFVPTVSVFTDGFE